KPSARGIQGPWKPPVFIESEVDIHPESHLPVVEVAAGNLGARGIEEDVAEVGVEGEGLPQLQVDAAADVRSERVLGLVRESRQRPRVADAGVVPPGSAAGIRAEDRVRERIDQAADLDGNLGDLDVSVLVAVLVIGTGDLERE